MKQVGLNFFSRVPFFQSLGFGLREFLLGAFPTDVINRYWWMLMPDAMIPDDLNSSSSSSSSSSRTRLPQLTFANMIECTTSTRIRPDQAKPWQNAPVWWTYCKHWIKVHEKIWKIWKKYPLPDPISVCDGFHIAVSQGFVCFFWSIRCDVAHSGQMDATWQQHCLHHGSTHTHTLGYTPKGRMKWDDMKSCHVMSPCHVGKGCLWLSHQAMSEVRSSQVRVQLSSLASSLAIHRWWEGWPPADTLWFSSFHTHQAAGAGFCEPAKRSSM